jgi:hypothetical protein
MISLGAQGYSGNVYSNANHMSELGH